MPELPEVRTVVAILNNEIIGKKIKNIEIIYERIVQNDLNFFKENLKDQSIIKVEPLGKFIIFHLTNNLILISHLRMEGKYSLLNYEEKNPPHSCVIFYFYDNTKLVYHDTRKFGIMELKTTSNYLTSKPLSNLGPEPFKIDENNIENVYKKITKNKPIKELLMDQSIICGIGNIYADEILFKAKINPLTKGKDISFEKFKEIVLISKSTLTKAINLGGSTIKSYHPKDGIDGKFQNELVCYGHYGKPCPNCGTLFHKIFLNGRGNTFCPNCQINYELKKAVGITGIIGSGKSECLKIFNELGFKTLSCDKIVKNLYENNDELKQKINRLFFYKVLDKNKNKLNYSIMRQFISQDEILHENLENLIFPFVEDILIYEIKNSNDTLIIEVPLLFKAHLEYLFKKIIYVESDKETILERLKLRGCKNPLKDYELYIKNNNFKICNDVIVLKNNSDLNNLKQQIIKISKDLQFL